MLSEVSSLYPSQCALAQLASPPLASPRWRFRFVYFLNPIWLTNGFKKSMCLFLLRDVSLIRLCVQCNYIVVFFYDEEPPQGMVWASGTTHSKQVLGKIAKRLS